MDAGGFFFLIVIVLDLVLFVIPAGYFGSKKGQGALSMLLAVFLGPLGLLIACLLPDLKKQEEEKQDRLEQTHLLEQQIKLQREQLELARRGGTTANVPPPPGSTKIRVAKDGDDLGEMNVAIVKTMLNGGQLTLQDLYFDSEMNDWITLDCHPKLAI